MFKRITLRSILSFDETPLEMRSLNLVIGPNASGKSNFIEVLGVLQALPRDLAAALRNGLRIADWQWKGEKGPAGRPAGVEVVLERTDMPLVYEIGFDQRGDYLWLSESLRNECPYQGYDDPLRWFDKEGRRISLRALVQEEGDHGKERKWQREDMSPDKSVLAEIRDPGQYPEISFVAKQLDGIRLYRHWTMGRNAEPRRAQSADMPNNFLAEDAANLGLVLNRMERDGSFAKVQQYLERLLPHYNRLSIQVEAGTVQIFLAERSLNSMLPATRISDGTLRLLALLTVLCHPNPPPLVCIEEPELGLHPDALAVVADALRDASTRTQLVVTTHSEALVDEFTDDPASVVVCEKGPNGASQFRRLVAAELEAWLEDYRLGEVWRRGELGGNP